MYSSTQQSYIHYVQYNVQMIRLFQWSECSNLEPEGILKVYSRPWTSRIVHLYCSCTRNPTVKRNPRNPLYSTVIHSTFTHTWHNSQSPWKPRPVSPWQYVERCDTTRIVPQRIQPYPTILQNDVDLHWSLLYTGDARSTSLLSDLTVSCWTFNRKHQELSLGC